MGRAAAAAAAAFSLVPGAAAQFFSDLRAPEGPGEPRWPEIYVIGVAKGSSTSLFGKLREVPDVCAGHGVTERPDGRYTTWKEVNFWLDNNQANGQKWYLDHFRWPEAGKQDCRFMDGSLLIRDPRACGALARSVPQELHPRLRFLLVLREQLARDLSHANHFVFTQRLSFFKGNPDLYLGRYRALHQLWNKFQSSADLSVADMQRAYDVWTMQRLGEPCMRWNTSETLLKEDRGMGDSKSVHGWGCHFLAQGMYDLLLPSWERFRSQLLVLSFDTFKSEPRSSLTAVARFIGMKESADATQLWLDAGMPKINEKADPLKVSIKDVDHFVCKTFWKMFGPRNEVLYKWLEQNRGPAEEMPFAPFRPPPCVPQD